jgi:transposase
VAVAHSILSILYHVLKTKQPYRELGADYLDRINAAQLKRYFVKRLENLGLQVIVQNREKTAPLPT